MKNILLLLGICLLHTAAYAQSSLKTNDWLDKHVLSVNVSGAEMATVEMKKELQLTALQLEQIAQMNLALYEQIEQKGVSAIQDPLERSKALRTLQLENDNALVQVLSPQQLRDYLELEGRQNLRYVSDSEY